MKSGPTILNKEGKVGNRKEKKKGEKLIKG
jgi:hypothetical protein